MYMYLRTRTYVHKVGHKYVRTFIYVHMRMVHIMPNTRTYVCTYVHTYVRTSGRILRLFVTSGDASHSSWLWGACIGDSLLICARLLLLLSLSTFCDSSRRRRRLDFLFQPFTAVTPTTTAPARKKVYLRLDKGSVAIAEL